MHWTPRFFLLAVALAGHLNAEDAVISSLDALPDLAHGKHHYWLQMGSNTYGQAMLVPVIVIQGNKAGPTLGLTAALHGNELNGINIIHELAALLDSEKMKGRVIAIPGLNAESIQNDRRRFIDEEDLNRNFPGKANGNRSQQYAEKIRSRVLLAFDYHIDMHTASFGRVNSLYVRADLSDNTLRKMAELQQADIVLNSLGRPSAEGGSATSRTLRAEATEHGIPSITVEYGNPQVFQSNMSKRGLAGVLNTLNWLEIYAHESARLIANATVYCKTSYWIYMKEGGLLSVHADLKQRLKKGDLIATVRDAFGQTVREYHAPEDGIVIGKSTNPTNMSGGRILHLGIAE